MLICEGDQSGGIELAGTPFEVLWVQSLSGDIVTSGIPGIGFYTGDGRQMTVFSNTAPFGISTTGDGSPGIWIDSFVNRINSVASFQSNDIAVFSTDRITTAGEGSYGIVADGVTGIAHSAADVESRGGNILVYSYGSVLTLGEDAVGIDVFNSVSASASGVGQSADAQGGNITLNSQLVETHGDIAFGIRAQQSISAHANSNATATGGGININNAGTVTTRGVSAHGVAAHTFLTSIGMEAVGVGANINVLSGDIETFGSGASGMMITSNANVSSTASFADLHTGTVSVTGNGLISTHGNFASGIWFESSDYVIGNSPTSGAVTSATAGPVRIDNNGRIVTRGLGSMGIVVGRTSSAYDGVDGDADARIEDIVVNSNDIRTAGNNAFGIYVGGNTMATASGSSNASSGRITVNSHNLRTVGTSATGILVESVSFNSSTAGTTIGGNIVVNSTGVLSATGEDANGIQARSDVLGPGAVNGDIEINIFSGSVTGGSGSGAGIKIEGGANNTVTNFGTISALSGTAILGNSSNVTVENYGRVIGDVNMFGGTQAFNNHVFGVFETGALVALGLGTTTNAGVLSPGGTGTIQHTTILGGYEQTATGRYVVDIDFETGGTDYLLVMPGSGPVSLGGLIVPNIVDAGGPVRQFLILSAADGLIDDGLDVVDTAVADYSLTFDPALNALYLGVALDFAPRGLNRNQTSIGEHINAAVAADPGFEADDLAGLATVAALGAAYDQLSPEVFGHVQSASLFSAEQFSNELMSCREAGGPNAAIREGECLWARARATDVHVDATAANTGYDSRVGSFSAGLQMALADDWRLGVGAGYDLVSMSTSSGAAVDGERANLGAVVKYNPSPYLFAAGVAAGWGDFDTDRMIAIGGGAATASSSSETDYVSGWLHAAYLAERRGWYLKPLVDLRLTELDFSGARERGLGGAGLVVQGSRETLFSVSPALEIGTEFRFDALSVWRPFVRAGVTWRDSDEISTVASFVGSPAGIPGFEVTTGVDDVVLDIGAGVDVIDSEGFAMRAQYDGRFGSDTRQNSFSLKGSVPY